MQNEKQHQNQNEKLQKQDIPTEKQRSTYLEAEDEL